MEIEENRRLTAPLLMSKYRLRRSNAFRRRRSQIEHYLIKKPIARFVNQSSDNSEQCEVHRQKGCFNDVSIMEEYTVVSTTPPPSPCFVRVEPCTLEKGSDIARFNNRRNAVHIEGASHLRTYMSARKGKEVGCAGPTYRFDIIKSSTRRQYAFFILPRKSHSIMS